MKNISLVLTLIFCLFVQGHAYAQELIEVTVPGTIVSDDSASAKQALMDQAIETVSMENIVGLIGEEKTNRSKDLILNKIVKNSGKYVLSIRSLNFARKGSEYTMDTEMKVSLKGLRSMLLQQGLLYQMEGPPKTLPLIQITDRIAGNSFGWWYQSTEKEHSVLIGYIQQVHKNLKSELESIGFYTMTPVESKYYNSVPDTFRSENLQRGDYLFLGDFFKSSLVIRGQIIIKNTDDSDRKVVLDIKMEALQSGNGRVMGEVVRVVEVEVSGGRKDLFDKIGEVSAKATADLASQLSEAWKKGTFGSSVLKLAVEGPITPYQLEEFKRMVVLKIRDIKSLRERLIESNRTTFEIDSSSLPQQLGHAFRTTKLNQFKVEVENISSQGLTIKVESL